MDRGEIVSELIAPQDGKAGKENVRSNIVNKTGNLQPHLCRHVGDYVEVVVVPLYASLILCTRSDLAVPGRLQIIVVSADRTSRRKSGQRIYVRRLFQIVPIPVGHRKLVVDIKVMIQSARRLVLAAVKRKETTLSFKLV